DPAVHVVQWRILEEDAARRDLDVRLDDLEDRSATGPVRLPVDQSLLDVVETAEREEVVLLVVVERCSFAHPPPHRVGVGVDVEVIGIVIDALAGDRHDFGHASDLISRYWSNPATPFWRPMPLCL